MSRKDSKHPAAQTASVLLSMFGNAFSNTIILPINTVALAGAHYFSRPIHLFARPTCPASEKLMGLGHLNEKWQAGG